MFSSFLFLTEAQFIYNMILVLGVQHRDSEFLDYTPFKVIIKYWLYSLCCTIYLRSLFST